jgi:hypothetical protein
MRKFSGLLGLGLATAQWFPGLGHITGRGIDWREIFRQDLDRGHWLELLPEFIETYRLVLHAYALIHNHYHLLLEQFYEVPNASSRN